MMLACPPLGGATELLFNSSFVHHGAAVNVWCGTGHQLKGAEIVQCMDGQWMPTDPICLQGGVKLTATKIK